MIVIDDEEDAEPLAEALLAGGLDLIEVTFRTAAAPAAPRRILRRFPEMLVGAGTVGHPRAGARCLDLGVPFGVARAQPGDRAPLHGGRVPPLPGVMSPSDIEGPMPKAASCRSSFRPKRPAA